MIRFIFLICVVNVAVIKADLVPDRESLLKFIQAAVNDCYEDEEKTIKVEVTDAAFESLITNDPNPLRNTKCMRYCVMEAHNLYTDEGNLDPSQMEKLFRAVYQESMDEEKLKTVRTTAESCSADNPDRCEKAHSLTLCMINGLKDKGIDLQG